MPPIPDFSKHTSFERAMVLYQLLLASNPECEVPCAKCGAKTLLKDMGVNTSVMQVQSEVFDQPVLLWDHLYCKQCYKSVICQTIKHCTTQPPQ